MSSEQNKALIRRFFDEAWNKHNPAAVDEFFAADFVDRSAPIPGISQNREGLKQFIAQYVRAFPDAHINVEDQVQDGDKVVTRFTARGTQTGELMGMPASGKKVAITGLQLDRISGGKVVESWVEFDQLLMLQQIGVVPAPAEPVAAIR
jgi:steroid delta-isomerase-like uncharacterized protein